jgi:lipopolysaccharide/colanic/teichoic acid biosynthesis glycosyltransferase
VGDGFGRESLAHELNRLNGTGPEVVGIVAGRGLSSDSWRELGDLEGLVGVIEELRVSDVAVCLDSADWPAIEWLARVCEERGVRLTIPGATAIGQSAFVPSPIVSGARVVDVVFASIGLVLAAPIIAIGAAAILLSEGRPVFFRQTRAGKNGRPFSIVKLRTMGLGADERRQEMRAYNEVSAGAFKMTDDPRITRLGHLLRRLSIDELPQFWNVLRGEMSIVGPRPHPFDDVAEYLPWHVGRLAVKPGVTGLWQVELRGSSDFDEWVKKDLEYITHRSVWLDLKIIARTIPAVVRGTGR